MLCYGYRKQERKCTYKRKTEKHWFDHCGQLKVKSVKYYEYAPILAIVMQHAKRIYSAQHCIFICGHVSLFHVLFTLSHKSTISEKILKHKTRVLILLQLLSETFLILRRIQRDIFINVHRSSRDVPIIPVRLQSKLNFLETIS
jgi:hypothetical protein